jgi:mRNA turnover protein 4
MPLAKKNKVVSLTKVKPKVREHKEFIVNKVHTFLDKYKFLYVLSFDNMSTNNFKSLRESLTDSKFLMGKNKVIGVALGVDEENTYRPNTFRITQDLKGHCTLFFTNRTREECEEIFNKFEEEEYATGGAIAPETIVLQKGLETLKRFGHSMEPHLRQLGLPTRLVNSQIELLSDYLLAEEGKPLTVEKCKILKLMDRKMSRLKFQIKSYYDGKNYKRL